MKKNGLKWLLPCAAALAGAFITAPASAGIPECNGMRLEDAFSCEIRGNLDCEAGCDDFGVYKKACATQLHTVCQDTCTLDPEPSCTDGCTEQCSADCDAGVNVICQHNCFGECVGVCDGQCADSDDPETCRASCEATCDGECDSQCALTVNGSCYQHCIECCGGSCGAQANMTCQTDCQEQEFESCEYEFRADCSASCQGDGALFCDGEFVMAGPELHGCLDALIAYGIMEVEDAVEDVEDAIDGVSLNNTGGCSVGGSSGLAGLAALFSLGLGARRRRRR